MSQDPVSELAGDVIQACRSIVIGRGQRVDRRPRIRRPVHVPDMDLVKRSFANAEHQGALLLEANVGRAFDQVRAAAIGDAPESAHTAWHNYHSISRIRSARDVGTDIRINLLANFIARSADDLCDEVAASLEFELLDHDPQPAIGGDEVDRLYALIGFDREQQVLEEQGTACARGGNRQILRWMGQQSASQRVLRIGTLLYASQAANAGTDGECDSSSLCAVMANDQRRTTKDA